MGVWGQEEWSGRGNGLDGIEEMQVMDGEGCTGVDVKSSGLVGGMRSGRV